MASPGKPLHPNNPHRASYDFPQLIRGTPELAGFVSKGPGLQDTINFADPAAVRALNRALLKQFYGLVWWDIPPDCLCPPVPGRADYIHYLAELWTEGHPGSRPQSSEISVLDIGVGANCIYPIIGHRAYGWRFVGSDINANALRSAQAIIDANPVLAGAIELRPQGDARAIFDRIINPGEHFDLSLCNPPFHGSLVEARQTNQRRLQKQGIGGRAGSAQNFGGQGAELWCDGGEAAFIGRMIAESARFAGQVDWFTSLVSRRESLAAIYRQLKLVRASAIRTIPMAQGQKVSRLVAWSFARPG